MLPSEDAIELNSVEVDNADKVYESTDNVGMRIETGLYLGPSAAEQCFEMLRDVGITHILQVADSACPSHPDSFNYMQVRVQDLPSEDLLAHFPTCFAFIDDAIDHGGRVLVHCREGVSRSATVCIGYLMKKHGIGYDSAFRRIHAVRPWIMPNSGFQRQLRKFESIQCSVEGNGTVAHQTCP